MKRFILTVASPLLLLLASSAHADLDVRISFTQDGTPAAFSVPIGETINVPVYVLQFGDVKILTQRGLFGAGVKVTADTKLHALLTDAKLATHWKGTLSKTEDANGATGVAVLKGDVFVAGQPTAYVFPPGTSNSVLIGNVSFQGLALGQTVLSATDPDTGSNIVTGPTPQVALDADVFANPSSVTITTVPEPGTLTLGLMALLAVGAIHVVRRRRG